MRPSPSPRGDDRPGFSVEVFYTDGPIGMGSDHVELDCHGRANTHLDALNHISIGGHWYAGWPVDDADGPSVEHLAEHGLFTRGVFVDVPKVRATPWADADAPVEARTSRPLCNKRACRSPRATRCCSTWDAIATKQRAIRSRGLREGHAMPGVGRTAAEWIADNHVSMLCWDFLDSSHPSQPFVCVHRLIWAIGLLLVDNCELGAAARAAAANSTAVGGLVVAPLAIPGGTGCSVRPLWLL